MVLALPVTAAAKVDTPALNAYARARLADGDGALKLAVSNYRTALEGDPTSVVVAMRSYRQAIESGDMALALSSARVLDAAGTLPHDGTLLLIVDALTRKDWAAARRLSLRLREEGNFAFLAPILDSWVSLADGPYAPPVVDASGRFSALTQRYVDEHAGLQLLERGQVDQAIPAIDRALALRTNRLVGLRVLVASRLAALGRRDEALAYLPAELPDVADAREAIAGSRRLSVPELTPARGFARLLARLSDDVSSGDARSVALVLARLATFADPGNAEFRLGIARQLSADGHPDFALIEVEKVPAKSWYALAAQDVRVDALMAADRRPEALALAQALAARPDAGPSQQLRLANILADGEQYDAAVAAYRAAQRAYPADAVPWSLYLLEGSALERGGRWEEARATLQKAIALAPDEPVLLNYLGYAQVERRQDLGSALALLRKASTLRPDDPSITDSLGWAHYVSGDARAAVPVLERAAAGAPDDVTVNEHLGDALWTVGRRYEARYAWTAASAFAEGDAASRLRGKVRDGLRPDLAAP